MFSAIVLSFIYGLLPTFLVHPWYIKGLLKGKTLFKNFDDYYNISRSLRNTLYILSVIEFLFIFLLTLSFYSCGDCIFIPFIPTIIVVSIFAIQIAYVYVVYDFFPFVNSKKFTTITFSVIFIVIILIQSSCNFKNITIPNIYNITEGKLNISYFIPESSFKFDAIIDIDYYNDKNCNYYLYTGEKQSKICIIDNTNIENSKNITVNDSLKFSVWNDGIRKLFKSEQVNPYGLIVTDDNKVFKVFYIIDTKPLSTKYEFSHFVLKDISDTSNKLYIY